MNKVDQENVALIQKCNIILKTAGLNASITSYEQLELAAPVIFVKVFEALYNIKLRDFASPRNTTSHASNMNSVLNKLRELQPSHLLYDVIGEDIVEGHRGSLVKIVEYFFDEAQKRVRAIARQQELDDHAMPKFVAEHHRSLKKSEDKRRDRDVQGQDTLTEKLFTRFPQRSVPTELDLLMDRVEYLERKLQSNRQPEATQKSPTRKKKKKKRPEALQTDDGAMGAAEGILSPANNDEDRVERFANSRRQRLHARGRRNQDTSERHALSSSQERPRMTRPSSAPLGGRSHRVTTERPQSSSNVRRCTSEEASAAVSPKKKPAYPSDMYTYDLVSGRRIPIEQAKRYQELQQFKNTQDVPTLSKKKDAYEEPVATVPRWPGYSTQRSVAEWLERSKQEREGGITTSKKLPPPHSYRAYAALENLDIVVTVEHCFKCSKHSISLRHDDKEYVTKAENVLRTVSQIIHSNQSCVRLGVSRFCAHISDDGRATDANSRIGALEVQVAYRDQNGNLTTELLHSKLHSQRWPSKSVLEKRLKSFLSQVNIQSYMEQNVSEMEQTNGSDGLSAYPVGIADWLQTPIADPLWRYLPPEILVGEPEDGLLFMNSMQWVFDARSFYTMQHLPAGTLVSIIDFEHQAGEVEPLGMLGTLKKTFKDPKTMTDMVIVQLKHLEENITCKADSCVEARKAKNSLLNKVPNDDVLPHPLFCLLHLAQTYGIAEQWNVLDDTSDKFVDGSLFLCHASFFRTVHDTVWSYARKMGYDNCTAVRVGNYDDTVNLHLSYGEDVLNWVFRKYGRSINVMKLLDLMREKLRESSPTLTTPQPVRQPLAAPFSPTEAARQGKEKEEEKEIALVTKTIAHVAKIIKQESICSGDEKGVVHSLRNGLRGVCLRLSESSNDLLDDENNVGDDMSIGLERFFRAYDRKHNGEITLGAFSQTLEQFGLKFSDDDLECLWATLDRDGSKSINFHELLSFLNANSSANIRELGELWCIIWDNILLREGTGDDESDKENSELLANLEDTVYQNCESNYCVIKGSVFMSLLRHENLISQLSDDDVVLLLSSFSENSSEIIKIEDIANATVLFEDFFSWLQPVDIKLVAKRVIRFLKAIFQHEKGLDMGVNSDADMMVKLDPMNSGRISKSDFRQSVSEFGLPMSCAEVRSIFLHFGCRGVMTHEDFQRLLSTKRNEIPARQQSPHADKALYENDFDDAPSQQHVAYNDVVVALKSFDMMSCSILQDLKQGELTLGVAFREFYQEETLIRKSDSSHMYMATIPAVLPFSLPGEACRAGEVIDIAIRHEGVVIYSGSLPSAALNDDEEMEVSFSITLSSKMHGTCEANGVFSIEDPDIGVEDVDLVISQFDISCGTPKFDSSLKKCCITTKFQKSFHNERFEFNSVDNHQCLFVEWNRIHINRQAFLSRQRLYISLTQENMVANNVIFSGYIAVKSLMILEKNNPSNVQVISTASMFEGMTLSMNVTMREAQVSRSSRIQSMDGAALALLQLQSLHSDGEDEDSHQIDEPDNADLFDLGSSFMGSFNECDSVSPLKSHNTGKLELSTASEVLVRFSKLHAKDLKSVELMGSNDPFINLSFGADWSQRTTTRQDAGSEAEWIYDAHDHSMLFEASGRELDEIPLKIEVFDENSLVKSKLIGRGEVHVRQSGKIRVELHDENAKHSGIVELDVTVDVPEPHLKSGVLQLNKMGFMLKSKKKTPKQVRVAMTLGYWHHALEAPLMNSTANWPNPNLTTDIEGEVLRKRKLHLEVFFDGISMGKAKCSLRGLLSKNSSAIQDVAVDVTDDAYQKVGRIFLNAEFSKGMDHDTLATKDHSISQKQILMQLFAETGGANEWKETLLWNPENDVSTWGELEVNGDNLVTELRLNYNNLNGLVPSCIGLLDTLQSLELFGNKLTGDIPHELGSLTNLRRLYLNANSLTGNLPVSLSNLQCLEEFDVSQNLLSGHIPRELAIPSLTLLVLSENNFVGPLPVEFTELFLLSTFACDFVPYVDDRKMSSAWIEYQYNLEQETASSHRNVDQSSRSTLGSLRDVLVEMSESPEFFDEWGSNSSSIPGVTFDRFNSVSSLILRGLSLYGDFPTDICGLAQLVFLDMSKNNLQGALPNEMNTLTSLRYLYLRENYLDGDAMNVVCSMTSLRAVDLSENQISGVIPCSLGDMCYLEKLYLRENQLTGIIPIDIQNLKELIELDLSSNQLSGSIPDLSANSRMSYLDLSSNQLSGNIPETIGTLINLRFLSLSFNLFEGTLPTSLSRLQRLDEIQLVGTNIINHTEDIPKAKMMLKRRLPSLNHISM